MCILFDTFLEKKIQIIFVLKYRLNSSEFPLFHILTVQIFSQRFFFILGFHSLIFIQVLELSEVSFQIKTSFIKTHQVLVTFFNCCI